VHGIYLSSRCNASEFDTDGDFKIQGLVNKWVAGRPVKKASVMAIFNREITPFGSISIVQNPKISCIEI
jgi:hypothetical protein